MVKEPQSLENQRFSARSFLDARRVRVLYSLVMIRTLLAFVLTAAALPMPPVVAQGTPQTAPAARSRDIYVSVQSRDDTPITGLTAADFTVREDGTAREVLKAE